MKTILIFPIFLEHVLHSYMPIAIADKRETLTLTTFSSVTQMHIQRVR